MAKGQVTVGDQPRADTRQLTQDVNRPSMDYRASTVRPSGIRASGFREYGRQRRY